MPFSNPITLGRPLTPAELADNFDLSQTLHDEATTARDQAVSAAGIFASTTAGIAGTTNGQYFCTPSVDSAKYLVLYRNNAGTAVEVSTYPSKAAVDAVLTAADGKLPSSGGTITGNLAINGTLTSDDIGTNDATALALRTNNAERLRIDASGNILVTGSGGLGYGVGSGGTVTQATSKSTAVTLNKPTGRITMHNAALAANTTVSFQFNNASLMVGDSVICQLMDNGSSAGYQIWTAFSRDGFCTVHVRNITGGSLSEALVISFHVIRGGAIS